MQTDQIMDELVANQVPVLQIQCGVTKPNDGSPRPGAFVAANPAADLGDMRPELLANIVCAGIHALMNFSREITKQTGKPVHPMVLTIMLEDEVQAMLKGGPVGNPMVYSDFMGKVNASSKGPKDDGEAQAQT